MVCWKPPSSDGGAKISNYFLEKREKKQNKWMSVTTKKIVETSYEVTGLIEGFEYEFRVKCENMGGESEWSEISESIIPKSDQSPRAPVFREEIRDMTVKYHANATFVTKVHFYSSAPFYSEHMTAKNKIFFKLEKEKSPKCWFHLLLLNRWWDIQNQS